MSASRNLWRSEDALNNMLFHLVLVVLLSGVSFQGVESRVPTSKECRAHVEKALDQYFDSKDQPTPPDQEPTRTTDAPSQIPRSITTDDDEDTTEEPLGIVEQPPDDEDHDNDNDDDPDNDTPEPECDDQGEIEEDNVITEDDNDLESEVQSLASISAPNEDDDEDNNEDGSDEINDETETKKEQSRNPEEPNATTTSNVNDKGMDDEKYYPFLYRGSDGETYELKNLKKGSIEVPKGSPRSTHVQPNRSTSSDTSYQESEMEVAVDVGSSEPIADETNDTSDIEDDDDQGEVDDDQGQVDDDQDEMDDNHEEVNDIERDSSEIAPEPSGQKYEEQHDAQKSEVTGRTTGASVGVAQELPKSQPIVEQPKIKEDPKEVQEIVKKSEEKPSKVKEEHRPPQIKEKEDEDAIENIYEEDEDYSSSTKFRSRDHIDAILGLDDVGTDYDNLDDKLAQSIFRDIKRIHATGIREMEMLYKFTDSTTRLLGDAEIFGKPMILFLGPWGTGKSTIINYLLGIERTPYALKTGTGITDVDFNVITYGDQRQVISGTELAADWRYASLQKFGQGFLDHFKSVTMAHTILKKVNLVDTPGILESRKNTGRGYSFNDAFQWFIDRADAIYVVLDPTKVDIGAELGAVFDQLKGREVRFILNKSDSIRRSDLMRVVGQLFWNLSPLMSGTEAPVIYATSLSTKPFNPSAPAKFLFDQESNFLYDLKEAMGKRVENRILYARRHAVRVRNHAKMVDCYLATYYRHKSIFSSKRNVAKLIIENPMDYHIYEGLSSLTNVSRYDLPDPTIYKSFFKLYPLYDFKPLASTCSYFRGCPMDKLDNAIANELPELFTKYKKAKNDTPQSPAKAEGR